MSSTVAYILAEYPVASETFIVREIEALEARGFTVLVFSLRRPGRESPDSGSAGTRVIYGPPALGAACAAGSVQFLTTRPAQFLAALRGMTRCCLGPSLPRRVRRFAVAVKFARLARRYGVDHVHAHFAYVTADVGHAMAVLLGKPFSVSAHAWDLYAQTAAALGARLACAERIFLCTRRAYDYVRGLFPSLSDRMTLAPHGVVPEQFNDHATPTDIPLVLGVGRLEQKKGFCYLIDACHILKSRGRDFRCQIIGGGAKRRALQRMVDTLDLAEQVDVVGPLPQRAVQRLYAQATAVVLPSVVGTDGDRDGLANVLLEAMAAGTPVISTTAAAAAEAVEDGNSGFLVPPHDPDAIAERLEDLFDDRHLCLRLGAAGRQMVARRFDIRENIRPLADCFAASGSGPEHVPS